MTFSVVARCAQTGMFGVAVASSSPAVAARCAYARAHVGAVASQNITDPRLGPRALELMALGVDAAGAIATLRRSESHMEYRQVLAVDSAGRTAIHSGPRALGIWSEAQAPDVACGGNLLAAENVPSAMVAAFLASRGSLGDRLLETMRAGLAAGGEAGPIRSAGLKIVHEVEWAIADLRIDWTQACPIQALANLWAIYAPQLEVYVTRAIDPTAAPSFGVPGDL